MSAAWAAPRRRWSETGNALKAAADGLRLIRGTVQGGSASSVVLPRRTQSESLA